MEQPSGMSGLRGIWPVHWEIASISGASFTNIFPLGEDLPGSLLRDGDGEGFWLIYISELQINTIINFEKSI